LAVERDGTGSGTVASSPPGIDCGTDCTEIYPFGEAVTLTATPDPGSTFAGWSGDCSGTGLCEVTMDDHRTVTATFLADTRTLTVETSGSGSGTVTSAPPGIDCGADCTEAYAFGTVVALTAIPASNSTFTGWSGDPDCIPNGVVTMNADKTCIATFDLSVPPTVLLVDDDDNFPNVRSFYTAALDAVGVSYAVWDTFNSDSEPNAATLASYETVVWFTGHEFDGFAGPGPAGEASLATWLSGGGCLLLSSQDYHYDRGLTPFMANYLGVASVTNDVGQTVVTGAGSAMSGLGPYSLAYPFINFSDEVSPSASAEVAFTGDQGDAAVSKDAGAYRTVFLGFPFEALPQAADRQEVLERMLEFCAEGGSGNLIFEDGFESGDMSAWSTVVP
jgi:hypothetical protein